MGLPENVICLPPRLLPVVCIASMSFVMDAVGIDGLEDMKPTSGITAVGRKDRKEKEGKVEYS